MKVVVEGVLSLVNMMNLVDWIDLLWGYMYDLINCDVLLWFVMVKDGCVVLLGGVSYGVLVLLGVNLMNLSGVLLLVEVVKCVGELKRFGVKVIDVFWMEEILDVLKIVWDFIVMENGMVVEWVVWMYWWVEDVEVYFVLN